MAKEINIEDLRKLLKFLKPQASDEQINTIIAEYLSTIK